MSRNRAGLTLLELLVVLVVLAILATAALRSTEAVIVESRYDATIEQLEELEAALVSEPGNAAGSFVADIGRFPQPHTPAPPEPGVIFQELWDPTDSPELVNYDFRIRSAPSPDEDVRLACGWRGPYIRLGVASDGLFDGWGNELLYEPIGTDGDEVVDSPLLQLGIRSLGADGSDDGGEENVYDADIVRIVDVGSIVEGRLSYLQNVNGEDPVLLEFNGSAEVKLFLPDPAVSESLRIETATAENGSFIFNNVPAGRRALKAEFVVGGETYRAIRYFDVATTGGTDVRLVGQVVKQPGQP